MTGIRGRVASVVCLVLLATSAVAQSVSEGGRDRRIAVFGSSVPNGTGDELRKEGYTGRLRELLATRGWDVLNQSRGGDTTSRLAERFEPAGEPAPDTRYLLPVDPGYAIIALSLGNEGIKTASNADADRVVEQYAAGLRAMIERCREHAIVPIVTLAYSRADFGPREHQAVRRMNLLINSWDVPSVNLLGAVDDGFGRWAVGFEYDTNHPNAAGHQEMFHTFMPTLFDALAAGKNGSSSRSVTAPSWITSRTP
jgi:lysophospholipase L1-like esterase